MTSTLPVSVAYLEITVRGKTCSALIDTRSDRSLIPHRLVPSVALQPSGTRLYAANGSEITNLGTMVLRYQIGLQTLETQLVVSEDVNELIFGYD